MKKFSTNNHAVSEVIGIVLMLGMALLLFSLLYIFVFSYPFPENTPSARLVGAIGEEENTTYITIVHLGGSPLSLDSKVLIPSGNGTELWPLIARSYVNDINGDGYWGIGEELRYPWNNNINNTAGIQFSVIDPASNSIVMTGAFSIPYLSTEIVSVNSYSQLVKARSLGDISPTNVTLWYRFGYLWKDDFIDQSYVLSSHNMIFNNGNVTSNPVTLPLTDFVDDNETDVDNSPDKGTQSYFFGERAIGAGYDVLREANTGITHYVNQISNVDNSADQGTHSNFLNMQSIDGVFDVLTEKNTDVDNKDPVDTNTSNYDSIVDKGTETNFINAQETARDTDVMTIQEANMGGQDHTDAVDSNTSNYDSVVDKGTETNFINAQETARDTDVMTIQEANMGGQDHTDAVDSNVSNLDSSADKGVETSFVDCQETSRDFDYMTIQESQYSSTTGYEVVVVDSFSNNYYEWVEVGTTPYLSGDDYPANYIYTSSSGNDERWFTIANPTSIPSGASITATLYINGWRSSSSFNPPYANVYIDYTGSSGSDMGNACTSTDSSAVQSISIGALTATEANNLRVYFNSYYPWGSTGTLYIDYVYVNFSWSVITPCNIDFEYQWTAAPYSDTTEQVCFYVNTHTGSETLNVYYWTGSSWSSLGTITSTGWRNFTATSLGSATYTIQLRGATESSDSSQDSWTIDCMFLHTYNASNYNINLEYQWTAAPYSDTTEQVCFYVNTHTGSETLNVYYWTGSSWSSLGTITSTGWRNFTATSLGSATYTIQLRGATESSDSSQDSWTIDCMFLHTWSFNYTLDLEVQWTNVNFSFPIERLCIKTGSLASENLRVDVWSGSSWVPLISPLLANQWNNISLSIYLTSDTFTIRYVGTIESSDSSQSSWNIDGALLQLGANDYSLDLEVQWTNVDFNREYELLRLNLQSSSATENIRVDVWDIETLTWDNLFLNLTYGWNDASIGTWLTSNTLTIRYTDTTSSSDALQDSWMIDAALLYLSTFTYEGNITSINITKPSDTTWSSFNVKVNNTANSLFQILDQDGQPLTGYLNGVNNDISSISVHNDTIRLFGRFTGSVKLDSWSVTYAEDWEKDGTDTNGLDGWNWNFAFSRSGVYWFYSIGNKSGYSQESPPVSPTYDIEYYTNP